MSRLIVVCGPPCSGKSVLARSLAGRLGIPHLQMDEARKILTPASRHIRADIDTAYRAICWTAGWLLKQQHDVILDATYGRRAQRQNLETMAQEAKAQIFLVQCQVSAVTARRRFLRRPAGHAALDLTPKRVEMLAGIYPYCKEGLTLASDMRRTSRTTALSRYLAAGRPVRGSAWSGAARQSRAWPGPERDAAR